MDRYLLGLADDSLFNETTCHPLKVADSDPVNYKHDFAISESCVHHSAEYTEDLLLVDQATEATLIAGLVSPPLLQSLAESDDIGKQSGLAVAAARANRIAPCDPFSGNKMHLGVDIHALLSAMGISLHRALKSIALGLTTLKSEAKFKQKKEVANGQKLFRNSRGDVERNTGRSPFGLSSIGQSVPPGSLPGRR
jgi:hypothetical protein